MQINKHKTSNGINIINVNASQFKTNAVHVFIHNTLEQNTASKNALIPMILKRGSKDYPETIDLYKKLEELYGSHLSINIAKKGERQLLHFYMDGLNPKYIPQNDDILVSLIEVLNSILINPLIQDNKFRQDYFVQEQNNLLNLIHSRINDKRLYAIERCYELMCKNERYGVYEYGDIDHVKGLQNIDVVNQYKNIINSAQIDVVVIGDITDEQIGKISELFALKTDNSLKVEQEEISNIPQEVKTITEETDVTQGKLSMGFRTNVNPKSDDFYAIMMYSTVLGGGSHSKLFQNVREKESLAYYAMSRLEKYKGLMMIGSGIEVTSYDRAKELIIQQIEELNKGNISDNEYHSSIKTLESSYRAIIDEPIRLAEFVLGQTILDTTDDIETVINKIKAVKKEDIQRVAQNVILDTVYFMKPKEKADML